MDISLWMTRDPVVATPELPLAEAIRLMLAHDVRHLPVVEGRSRRLAGLVTGQEVLKHEAGRPGAPRGSEAVLVRDVMAPVAITARSDASIEEAARILRETRLGVLLVVNEGRLVGTLTDTDLLRAFLEISGAEESGCEVTLELAATSNAVAAMADLGRQHGMPITSVVSFTHEERRLGVVRFSGAPSDAFLDDVWRSARTVLRIRCTGAAPAVGS
jgi:acetoin utilization protein AcuB